MSDSYAASSTHTALHANQGQASSDADAPFCHADLASAASSQPAVCEDPGDCLRDTLADLDRTARMANPVLRNLWITQRYKQLSDGFYTMLGDDNANWCTFATWASKTAGRSIRNDEVPVFFRDVLRVEERFHEKLGALSLALKLLAPVADVDIADEARAVLRTVSVQVAEGNLKVFAELAPIFARFVDDVCSTPAYDESIIVRFESRLAPGPSNLGGQDLLKRAFRGYYQARATADPHARAQLMLLANCRIGLHEQTRLQPNIKAAIDAPITDLLRDAIRRRTPLGLAERVGELIGVHLDGYSRALKAEWEKVATRYAMNLSLPGGAEIPLGSDLPSLPRSFPPGLEHIVNQELRELMARFDDAPDTLRGSAANNWSNLNDRMRFIVDLFRSRQQDASLRQPPFTSEQLHALEAGTVPRGPL